MKAEKAKAPWPRKTATISPRPTDGVWDWKKRYWDLDDQVTVYSEVRPTVGTIVNYKVNPFGRIVYTVEFIYSTGAWKQVKVTLENLFPPGLAKPGEGSTIVVGG